MGNAKFDLQASARAEMLRQGFCPDFSEAVRQQIADFERLPATANNLDLRHLPWSSIDNNSSKDLDQIEVAERVDGGIRLLVAIADVDSVVAKGSPIDERAGTEALSVYVPGQVFPMLPDELSTDLTSLAPDQDRLAVVIEMIVRFDGQVTGSNVFRALVRNHVQLTYGRVAAWLGGAGDSHAFLPEIREQLQLQDEAARVLRKQRLSQGALQFDRLEAMPIIEDGQVVRIETRQRNRATELIEELMVAANEVMAQTLTRAGVAGIRRVVKSPERWPRIVQLAASYDSKLPDAADSSALAGFLSEQREKNPDQYSELSLSVLKLMGPGEYMVLYPGGKQLGHFGLAANDYTHSTAPNRRFADLVTQRLIKSVLEGKTPPYADEELERIARHCTLREDAARKVERTMQKRAAAFALRRRVGQPFRAVVTGVTPKGVFVRVSDPPVEGRVVSGERGLDVGDRVRLTLLEVDPEKGFIDFGK
jgi:VacB/RNase II family 3'-5' exoribonuclease